MGINTSKKNSPKFITVLYCTNLNGGKQYYKEKQSIFIIDLNSTTSVVGNNTCTTKRNSTILLIVLFKLQWWASILQRVTVQISLLYCTNFNGGHRYFKEKRSHSHYCTELTSMVGMDTSKRNSPILICVLCKLQRWAWILKRVTCLFV